MRKLIKTYEELNKIYYQAREAAVRGDLLLVMHCFPCIDGYFLVVSRDDTYSMAEGCYIVLYDDFEKWSIDDKKKFKRDYGYAYGME